MIRWITDLFRKEDEKTYWRKKHELDLSGKYQQALLGHGHKNYNMCIKKKKKRERRS
jgi:hypothetical protein